MPLLTALSVSLTFLSMLCAPIRNIQRCSSGQIILFVVVAFLPRAIPLP